MQKVNARTQSKESLHSRLLLVFFFFLTVFYIHKVINSRTVKEKVNLDGAELLTAAAGGAGGSPERLGFSGSFLRFPAASSATDSEISASATVPFGTCFAFTNQHNNKLCISSLTILN